MTQYWWESGWRLTDPDLCGRHCWGRCSISARLVGFCVGRCGRARAARPASQLYPWSGNHSSFGGAFGFAGCGRLRRQDHHASTAVFRFPLARVAVGAQVAAPVKQAKAP